MNVVSTDEGEQQSALNNSDLKGLLKAASLTEFHAETLSDGNSTKFEKSNSLFDLVRSNLLDAEIGKDTEHLNVSDIVEDMEPLDGAPQYIDGAEVNSSEVQRNTTSDDKENLKSTIDLGVANFEPSLKSKDAVEAKVRNPETQSKPEAKSSELQTDGTSSIPKVETTDGENIPPNDTDIVKSDAFIAEVKKIQIQFDQNLDTEKNKFITTLEAMFGSSNLIAGQMENQISDFVLAIASDLAGTKIDGVPAAFAKKISRVAKQIIGDDDKITVHLNPEDYNVLQMAKSISELKYTFLENETLRRGEFEVTSRKSSAGVSLFDFTEES